MYNSTGHVVSLVLGAALVNICSLSESLTIFVKGPTDPAAPYTPNRRHQPLSRLCGLRRHGRLLVQ
jgi:hypothetical protein